MRPLAQLLSARAIGAEGLRFAYWAGQMGQSVASGLSLLRRFFRAV